MFNQPDSGVGAALQAALMAMHQRLGAGGASGAPGAGGGLQQPPWVTRTDQGGDYMNPAAYRGGQNTDMPFTNVRGAAGGAGGAPQDPFMAAIQAAQGRMAEGFNPYSTGTQNEHAYAQQLGRRGLSQDQITSGVKDKANHYAKTRLAQMAQVADMMGGDFAKAFHSQDMSDPAAAYRALSGVFSQQSQSQGVADPRALLAQMLMRAKSAGAGH